MLFENFTESERQQFMEYMLDNKSLEDAIKAVDKRNNLIGFIEQLAQNDKDSKGLILAIIPESRELAGTYQLFDFKPHNMAFVTNKEDEKFLMLFTNEKAFNKHPDLQGLLYFIKDIFQVALNKEEINGVAFNIDSEYEILIDKFTIRAVLSLLDKKEGK